MSIDNTEHIFITGGCGFLGKCLLEKWHDQFNITVYNRDEYKQYLLKKQYPNINFVLGDIRDYDRMLDASKNCTRAVFAASMKQIDACTDNPEEAISTIINGAINSKKISIKNKFTSACFISTDKSRNASNLYGGAKFVAGESFILNPPDKTFLNSVIYGNVFNSSGSLLEMLNIALKNKQSLKLFNEEMTRFGIFPERAIDLIEIALFGKYSGANIVPKLWSFKVKDVFDIYKEKFGLSYSMDKPRTGEKIHEILLSSNDAERTIFDEELDIFVNYPNSTFETLGFSGGDYSSKDNCISKNQLYSLLKEKNII